MSRSNNPWKLETVVTGAHPFTGSRDAESALRILD